MYLHIGAMKTGTTYLQHLMDANRAGLAAAGYLFPGKAWNDHSRAARDVLGFAPENAALSGPSDGMWDRLAAEMTAHDGHASVFSMEFLSFAGPAQAERIVGSFPAADVHVVLTLRDAAATIPAQWQTNCRNIGTLPWRRFLRGIGRLVGPGEEPKGRAVRTFQRTQGIPRMLEVWGSLVPADHLHVVTVPPRGSDPRLLWERFAGAVGVDPGACSVDPDYSNPSLGHASTELLRRVNVRLRASMDKVPRRDYNRVVRAHLAKVVLRDRASVESRVSLNRRGHVLAARWNEEVRSAVVASRAVVAGDLDDLPVRVPDGELPVKLAAPAPEEVLAAAHTARVGLERFRDELRDGAPAGFPGEDAVPDPTDQAPLPAAVEQVAELVRECMDLARPGRRKLARS